MYVREIRSNGTIVISTVATGPITGVVKISAVDKYNENLIDSPTAAIEPYLVKVATDVLNVRAGAGTQYKINTQIKRNQIYTIVGEKDKWGKLKSGAGWIHLDYVKRVK